MISSTKFQNILKTLGPGILFASTAIGVSHLVQSTRAGAVYGFGLIWAVILANLLKYPFFEYGSRYANATGESIIDGYKRLSRWALWLYFLITIGSMFFVVAAIGVVTSGFMDNLFGIGNVRLVTILIFSLSAFILILGKYNVLDSLIKVIASVLLLSTLLAFLLTLFHGSQGNVSLIPSIDYESDATFLFLFALMGWMPTAVDLSTWNSLWTLERIKQTGYHPPLKETLFDFNFGYITSALLSICFVTLGAYVMFGTGTEVPSQSAAFANSVVKLYTATIGDWSYFVIAVAAFSIMFGTCIAVFDGYARSVERTTELLFLNERKSKKALSSSAFYNVSLIIIAVCSFLIIQKTVFSADDPKGFKLLVDLATTISFLIAPIVAVFNFRLVTWKHFPESAKPGQFMRVLSYSGIAFLIGFTLFFLVVKLC